MSAAPARRLRRMRRESSMPANGVFRRAAHSRLCEPARERRLADPSSSSDCIGRAELAVWRGVLIGFVAGCILVTTILREGRPEQRVHTIDPRADGPAVLTEGAPSNAARRA